MTGRMTEISVQAMKGLPARGFSGRGVLDARKRPFRNLELRILRAGVDFPETNLQMSQPHSVDEPSFLNKRRGCAERPPAASKHVRCRWGGLYSTVIAIAITITATLPRPAIAQTYRIDTLLGDFDPLEEVPLSSAWTDGPSALAIDSVGNIYFAESNTSRVRKVDLTGQVSTIAGSGLTGDSGDGGPATQARFGRITGLAVDPAGNVYVADAESNRIRRVDASGTIETFAGTGEFGWDGDGGPATAATLTAMAGLAADGNGNLYVADTWADRIRKIDADGRISTIAGTGVEGRAGDGSPAIEAQLNRPRGVAIDESGIIYVADTANHLVRRVDPDGTISTFAGNGDRGYSGDGGLATDAKLSEPHGVAIDRTGNVYIADTRNRSVRKVDPGGIITTVAGRGPRGRRGGQGAEVRLSYPRALAIRNSGDVFIADEWRDRVYRIGDDGTVAIFVGLGRREIPYPRAVAVDPDGHAYLVFSGAHSVVKVDPTGKITPFAGTGQDGFSGDGGPAVDAKLASPGGLELDDRGNVYIVDSRNHRIRMVDANGTIQTIAGTGTRGFSGDGGPATSASFNYPADVAVGPDGARLCTPSPVL